MNNIVQSHPKFIDYTNKNELVEINSPSDLVDIIGENDYLNAFRQSFKEVLDLLKESEWEGVLNKNDI